MLQVRLMDGSTIEIPRTEAQEILSYRHVFTSAQLKQPVEGLICHHGKILPVLGPLPEGIQAESSLESRPFLILIKGCAQVICGLPEFLEAAPSNVVPLRASSGEESELLDELDELLKSA